MAGWSQRAVHDGPPASERLGRRHHRAGAPSSVASKHTTPLARCRSKTGRVRSKPQAAVWQSVGLCYTVAVAWSRTSHLA